VTPRPTEKAQKTTEFDARQQLDFENILPGVWAEIRSAGSRYAPSLLSGKAMARIFGIDGLAFSIAAGFLVFPAAASYDETGPGIDLI
jgi:small neutral amino acid transporter SnatA (MarC family)